LIGNIRHELPLISFCSTLLRPVSRADAVVRDRCDFCRALIVGDISMYVRPAIASTGYGARAMPDRSLPPLPARPMKSCDPIDPIDPKPMPVILHEEDYAVCLRADGRSADVGSAFPVAVGDGRRLLNRAELRPPTVW
jgi:hypothetical protein